MTGKHNNNKWYKFTDVTAVLERAFYGPGVCACVLVSEWGRCMRVAAGRMGRRKGAASQACLVLVMLGGALYGETSHME